MKRLLLLVLLLPVAANSQELVFTAETTTGNGEVVPALTWSTTPAADSCIASGAWSGEQGSDGELTLPPIVSSATYSLECTWLASGTITLSWVNPTEQTDGTPYVDKGRTLIEYGPDQVEPWLIQVVPDPEATQAIVGGLAAGDWYFRARAVTAADLQSDPSNTIQRTLAATVDITESVTITVNPLPLPPAGLTTIDD